MKLLLLLLLPLFGKCQDRNILELSMNPLNISYGYQNTRIEGNLPNESAFILNSNYNKVININALELEALWYHIIGINIGLCMRQSVLNKDLIYNNFNKHIEGFNVEIVPTDYDFGEVPIRGGFKPITLEFGFQGNISIKSFRIVPSFTYLHSFSEDFYSVTATLTNDINNESFIRNYRFTENKHKGFRTGIDVRYSPSSKVYVGLKNEFVYFKGKGSHNIYDSFITEGSPIPYYHYSLGYYFGFSLGFVFYPKDLKMK
jgi:hypothetical protein